MKPALIGLLLLSSQISFAQFFTIREVKDDSSRMFPVIVSTQRPAVATKINTVLGQDWGFNANATNPFKDFGVMEEADFGYGVGANNERVFSITIESSYASCGLHVNRQVYNFDSHTGARIDENRLLGAEGLSRLRKSVHKKRIAAMKKASADTSDYFSKDYRDCLVIAEKETETALGTVFFVEQGIRFNANASCLEGDSYAYQRDVNKGPYEYSFGELLPMLSTYGFGLFVNQSTDTNPVKKLLRGTIDGKYAISLTILPGNDANTLSGMIVYDRVGTPIPLEGTMNGNQLVLHECEKPNTPLSDIEVSWDGGKLTGSFINLKSKKQMPFTASVVK